MLLRYVTCTQILNKSKRLAFKWRWLSCWKLFADVYCFLKVLMNATHLC